MSPLLVTAAIAFAAADTSPTLALELAPALPCSLNERLGTAAATRGFHIIAPGEADWVLSIHVEPGLIRLILSSRDRVVANVRDLKPTVGDCAALPGAVALLARSWVDTQLATAQRHPEVSPRAEPAIGATPPVREAPRVDAPNARKALQVPEPNREPVATAPPPVAPPPDAAPSIDPFLLEAGPLPHRVDVAAEVPPSMFAVSRPEHLQRAPRTSFSLGVTGGAAVGVGDQPIGFVRVGLEWGFREPWAVELDGGGQTSRVASRSEGAVGLSVVWGALSLRRTLFASGLTGLQLSGAAKVLRLQATATGFATRRSVEILTGGVEAGVGWRQELTGGLSALVRVGLDARWPQALGIGGLGTVLTLPAWAVGVEAGLAWNFL